MGIFKALGLGLALILLKLIIPVVFSAGANTMVNIFQTVDTALMKAQSITTIDMLPQ